MILNTQQFYCRNCGHYHISRSPKSISPASPHTHIIYPVTQTLETHSQTLEPVHHQDLGFIQMHINTKQPCRTFDALTTTNSNKKAPLHTQQTDATMLDDISVGVTMFDATQNIVSIHNHTPAKVATLRRLKPNGLSIQTPGTDPHGSQQKEIVPVTPSFHCETIRKNDSLEHTQLPIHSRMSVPQGLQAPPSTPILKLEIEDPDYSILVLGAEGQQNHPHQTFRKSKKHMSVFKKSELEEFKGDCFIENKNGFKLHSCVLQRNHCAGFSCGSDPICSGCVENEVVQECRHRKAFITKL